VPFLVWAGIRFCPLEAAGACIVLCGFATWGSLHGYGPFNNVTAMPLSLAAYLCVATTMTLTGAATVANQREVSERLLETLYRLEKTKDGEITRLNAELEFLRDELIRRVHARSRSERNRQASQQPRQSNEVIWFLEAETENILYVSPSYEAVWGRSREDLGRDAHAWLDAVIPEDREYAIQFVGQDFPGDRVETAYRIQRPDGSIRWIFDRGFVIRDPTGRPLRYLGLASDITELVQLGEVLSGGSYLSQHDLRLHFGLGSHERVDQAEVSWPDGKKETLTNLAVDRFYVVREGQGVVSSKLPEHRVKLP